MKKRIPGGFILLTLLSLLGVSFLSGSFAQPPAKIFFSHQLEHLINLQLIVYEDAVKVASGHGLFTFSGKFRESVVDSASLRFRFLSLLNKMYHLREKREESARSLKLLEEMAVRAWNYSRFLSGEKINVSFPMRIVEPCYEVNESFNGLLARSIHPMNIVSLRDLSFEINNFLSSPSWEEFARVKKIIDEFIRVLSSPLLGICAESIKSPLNSAVSLIEESNKLSSLSECIFFVKTTFGYCKAVVDGLEDWNDVVKNDKLRSLRDYRIVTRNLLSLDKELSSLSLQLMHLSDSVSDVLWFFDNKLISTKTLFRQNTDEFFVWFKGAEDSWSSFEVNKGSKFKVPDQILNAPLDSVFKSEELPPNYLGYFLTILPLFFVGFLIYASFSKQIRGMGAGAMNFGRSPAKLMQKGGSKVTFKDIAGVDEAKSELQEIVEFLRNPAPFIEIGARIPKGVLCVGPPGTGKTLIAKAVAGEAGRPFFSMSGSDFVEMFVGIGASRIRDTFDQARKQAPCIVFMDEIDAVGRHRGSGVGGGHDEREQTLNQLLVEMDGFDGNEGIILMAATNRPDVLDKALLRPGRFDRRVVIDLPDIKGRFDILNLHASKIKMGENVDLMRLSRSTSGSSGADLSNILNEAALLAVTNGSSVVRPCDIIEARDKVCFGKERRSLELDENDRWTTAVHEAGHAIVSKFLDLCDPVDKITIVPRGFSLGATYSLPTKNRTGYKRNELDHLLAMFMGGRCAEELLIGDISSGAQNDIERATQIARKMVCEWGMSGLGAIAYYIPVGGEYIHSTAFQPLVCSEETMSDIDSEISLICKTAKETAEVILKENKELLHRLSKLLIEFETLEGRELDEITAGTFDVKAKKHNISEVVSNEESSEKKEGPDSDVTDSSSEQKEKVEDNCQDQKDKDTEKKESD